jgi:hypothetical protein
MKDIFVSYRRSDSSGIVGRIIDRLDTSFGNDRIFRDLDAIDPGQDFGEVINRALQQCEVLLVVIGDEWISAANAAGERRLDNTGDWVRLEVSKALEQGIRVIPVLVEGADMPSASDLPVGLKPLANRNAAQVRDDPDFNGDMEHLCEAISKCLGTQRERMAGWPRKQMLLIAICITLAVLAIGGAFQYSGIFRPTTAPTTAIGEAPAETIDTPMPIAAPSKLHFLGIGINSYPSATSVTIEYAHKDIEYLQETLKDKNPNSRLGEFVSLYNSDATRAKVLSEIRMLRDRLNRDEVAIIAFAGIELVADKFYLLPHDADSSDPTNTAISADDIFSVMPNAKGQIIFLLDTCHSARFGEELHQINPGIITLASCSQSELAYESKPFRKGGGGAFTTAVGKGLKGAADANGDGAITLAELAEFARVETPKIPATSGPQHPVIIGDLLPIVLASSD